MRMFTKERFQINGETIGTDDTALVVSLQRIVNNVTTNGLLFSHISPRRTPLAHGPRIRTPRSLSLLAPYSS